MRKQLPLIFIALLLSACGLETEPNPDPQAGSGAGNGSDGGGQGGIGGDDAGDAGGQGGTTGGQGGTTGGQGGSADCTDNDGCAATLPQCSASGSCISCTSNAACEGRSSLTHCETSSASERRGECVACLEDDHCQDNDAGNYCLNNECVPCKTNADCNDLTKPECGADGHCTGCTSDNACDGRGTTEACVTAPGPKRGHCVPCVENPDCPNADAPQCKSDNTCGACTSDDACSGRDDKEHCNLRADAATVGQCVQCTGATEADECNGNSCKQSTGECTDTTVGSRNPCQSCEADSECGDGAKCVRQMLNGTDLGYFCFYDQATQGGGCADTISGLKPYSQTLTNVLSIDSTEASQQGTYCLPRTSCDAFADATTYMMAPGAAPCTVNSNCGVGNTETDGAYCIPSDFSIEAARNKCSYICDTSADCPSSGFSTCSDGAGAHFCRP